MFPAPAPGVVELRLLGRFVVVSDGAEVPAARFGGRKARVLLRMLATRRPRLVTNDELAEGLWPDRLPADPAANLQVLVNRVRTAVGRPDLVVTGTGGYFLTDSAWCVVDAEVVLAAIEQARRQVGRQALDVYASALGVEPTAPEPLAEDRYTDWAQPYRTAFTDARQDAWERAADLAIHGGETALAVRYATLAATAQPLREAAAMALVRALAAAGDRPAALGRYDAYRRLLADELGLDPSGAAIAVHTAILRAAPETAPVPPRANPAVAFDVQPLVGRADSLARIEAALSGPGGNGPPVIRVAGRSGAGKSRLLAELATRHSATLVRASWADRDEPWTLGHAIVRDVVDTDIGPLAALPTAMRVAVLSVVPDLADAAVPAPDVRSDTHFDPTTRWALVVEATARLLSRADRLLIVDDLQWVDQRSLQLLAALADRRERPPIVVAYRSDEVDAGAVALTLQHLPDTVTVTLGQLDRSAIEELVADPIIVDALIRSPDRTPLAVTELLRSLAAEGCIARGAGGRWVAASPESAQQIEALATVGHRRVIDNRIAAHSGPVRQTLRLLATFGREVSAGTLALTAQVADTAMLDVLATLAAADLVRSGDLGWGLSHDAVAEAVLAGASAAEQAALHAIVARTLDADGGDPAERARHWRGAGDSARGGRAYADAAASALAASALDEAGGLVEAGLALGAALPVDSRWRLLEIRAAVQRSRGDLDGARAALRAALDPRRPGPDRAAVLADLAMLASGAQDLMRASELAEAAIVEAHDDDRATARSLEVASIIDMNLDRAQRSRRRADEALARYAKLGDAGGAARVLDARAMATFLDGELAEGVDLLNRAADLFEDSGDLIRMITPRSTCGHGWVLMGDPGQGLSHTETALEAARSLGHPEGIAYASWHRAEALAGLGRTADAEAAGREALATATRLGHRGWTATAWRAIGIALQTSGDDPGALAAFRSSLGLALHLDLFGCWAAARAAISCVRLGRLDEAEALVGAAADRGPALGRYEARWAAAELAVARREPDAWNSIERAETAARAGGAAAYLPRLAELAAMARSDPS